MGRQTPKKKIRRSARLEGGGTARQRQERASKRKDKLEETGEGGPKDAIELRRAAQRSARGKGAQPGAPPSAPRARVPLLSLLLRNGAEPCVRRSNRRLGARSSGARSRG